MNELYWITRLGAIKAVFVVLLVTSALALTIFTISYFSNYDSYYDTEKKWKDLSKSMINKLILPLIVGVLGVTFIPTTKEALLIWGVGGTIDYLKSNPTSKQLPDKCIKALDKWVDGWTSDSVKVKRE